MTGVRCGSNVAGCNIINTFCSGNGTVGSIGINGGCDMISGCNIIGWATGVRWAGSGGCALIGTRFEVCNTAIHTGIDAYGNSLSSQGLNITAIQCERCDTDVYWESTQGTIIGCLFTGIEAVAGGGAPRNYGIRVTSASSLLIAASIVVGNLSVAGVDLSGTGGQYSYVTCIGVSATVGSGGGVTWNLGYGAANTGVKLINCNAGFTPTFADLPATAFKGDRAFITNCNTTTFNNAAAGGGTNNVPVFYDGSAWKVG
jgi:hypothetical protein